MRWTGGAGKVNATYLAREVRRLHKALKLVRDSLAPWPNGDWSLAEVLDKVEKTLGECSPEAWEIMEDLRA